MKSRLIVRSSGDNLVQFDETFSFDELLPVSVNYAVADVREPDKIQSDHSKTITIPANADVNRFFEHAYEINLESLDFNANLKSPCRYEVNGIEIFKGDLQLLKVIKIDDGINVVAKYECALVGSNSNLFLDIANLYLTDLDFSDLDHTLTYGSGLFNPTLGSGFVYPFIDYGMTPTVSVPAGYAWVLEHLKPAIFENEYIHRIVGDAGYSLASNYLSSTYQKSIIIPDCNEAALRVDRSTLIAEEAYVGINSTFTTVNSAASATGSGGVWNLASADLGAITFDEESTPFYDTGSNFSGSVYTCPITAKYALTFTSRIRCAVTFPSTSTQVSGSIVIYNTIQRSTDGGTSWVMIGISTFNQTISSSTQLTIPEPVTQWTGNLNSGDKLRCRSYIGTGHTLTFLDGSSNPVNTGTASIDLITQPNSSFFISFDYQNNYLPYGGTVVMNNTIPENISQLDFLTSVMKAENLYIEVDKDNPKRYILEPRADFILSTYKDWNGKRDVSEPVEIYPMGELEAKRYHFTYKSDSDYFNKSYQESYGYVYGRYLYDTNSDFLKDEKKIELCFSPTPIALTGAIVAPRLYKEQGVPQAVNIRRLYFGGQKSVSGVRMYYNDYASNVAISTYPFCGHVDDPANPTLDLNFGIPDVIYWNLPTQSYTDNNRFNERWSEFIYQITDRDSKIVIMKVYLDAVDIASFSFRYPVWIEGTKYFVNAIKDYDPQNPSTCTVELLKLAPQVSFTPNNSSSINSQNSNNQSNNIGGGSGYNNQNYGGGAIIGGDNNYIGAGGSTSGNG